MKPVDSGATIYLPRTRIPLSLLPTDAGPASIKDRLLSRTGLKEINKSREKMRCKKKTESIIPSKIKVLSRG